jgi:hypothetical protein
MGERLKVVVVIEVWRCEAHTSGHKSRFGAIVATGREKPCGKHDTTTHTGRELDVGVVVRVVHVHSANERHAVDPTTLPNMVKKITP